MTNQHGDFIWSEPLTKKADASMAFCATVFGWSYGGSDDYREIQAGNVLMVRGQ